MMRRISHNVLYQIKLPINDQVFTKHPSVGCRLGTWVAPYGSCTFSIHVRAGHLQLLSIVLENEDPTRKRTYVHTEHC